MANKNHINRISDILNLNKKNSENFYKNSLISKEFLNESDFENWFENRLKKNIIFLNKSDYEEMCLSSLKSLKNFSETDFGSSRQRDFNQKWADTTRGYLGEKAFQKFLSEKFNIEAKLKHKKGELSDFINTDIHQIKVKGEEEFKKPRKTIGIKTTNFNGMWLDIPGAQFHHSDYHVLIKLILEKNHMFSFFKEISIFKDKLLKRAIEKGYFKKHEADNFFDAIPNLDAIPAYITGFVKSDKFQSEYEYEGNKGRKHYTITSWKGKYKRSFLKKIKKEKSIEGDIMFQGIKKFSHDDAYIFNTGNLNYSSDDWAVFIKSL